MLGKFLLGSRDWQVSISNIHREANAVGDRLAAYGHKLSLGSHYFEKASDVCMIPLWADFVGISFPCRVKL